MIASPENRNYQAGKSRVKNFLNGFDSNGETQALRRNFNAAKRGGLISHSSLETVMRENLTNMVSHRREYTMSDPVVLNPVALDEYGNLVNSESGYRILDMVSPDERGGAVSDFVEEAGKKLASAAAGDMVIGISAAGHSGRREPGREIIYEETQIYAFKKGRGRLLEGITFISDLTFDQCLSLYGEYGKEKNPFEDPHLSEREKVEELTRRPIIITGGSIDFESILDSIEAKMGGDVMRKSNGLNRTFEEARELLKDPDSLKALPEDCSDILDMYRAYITANIGNINNEGVFSAIKQRMEIALLEITRLTIREDKDEEKGMYDAKVIRRKALLIYESAFKGNNIDLIDYNSIRSVYEDQIRFLRMRPGCLGKISSSFSLTGQTLGDILSGTSNVKSILSSSAGKQSCKICGMNPSVEGGCGYCHGCADKAA